MFATKDRIFNAPKFYRRKMYAGLPLGGYVRSHVGHRRLLRTYLNRTPPHLAGYRSNRSYRSVFYPPSYFSGSLSRFLRAKQAVTREKATDDFLATCQRYDLLPVYIPMRRSYRPCQIIRMAKRAGELFIREKVRSAYRRWLDKKLAPYIGAVRKATPTGQQKQEGRKSPENHLVLRSLNPNRLGSMARVATPPYLPPTALSEVGKLDLWTDRNSTPIFPLPIIRHPARFGKNRISRKRVCALIRTPTPPLFLPDLFPEERLLTILNEVRGETRIRQRQREELLRKIKQLQSRAHQRREQVREMWRKRYLEAKKITPRLEEECSRLRQELEKLHRELLAKVQAGVWALLTISGKTERPSNKLSYKIMIARLLQEIEDLTRRVEGTRLKLHTEVKLRSMAEKDVRNLREELLKKKIQVTLTRNQEQAAMGNGLRQQYFISAV
ncbi:SPATA1_C domain-containing protein [Trichonephila inaurata madagascariensis]|uniref:SPATA1_C domain-containing protein n=1 Tax=Trichonephila inaurata madagascariensis TaxID=2747483 RepID=A0A8X6YAT6_9ARAC|nr:SPATA1_C domain-containing protein [Trichonephila inaurata madagascariensis]